MNSTWIYVVQLKLDTIHVRKKNSPAYNGNFIGTYDANYGYSYSHNVYGHMTPKMFFLQLLMEGFDKIYQSSSCESVEDFIIWLKVKQIEKFSIKFHHHTYISLSIDVMINTFQIIKKSIGLHVGELEIDFDSIDYFEHTF